MKNIPIWSIMACVLVTVAPLAPCVAEETSTAAIELGTPLADNAILQRQMPVPIWGWSKPGTKVA